MTLARDICPASSTNSTSTASSISGRANSHWVPAARSNRPSRIPVSTSSLLAASRTPGSLRSSSPVSHFWMARSGTPASTAASLTASSMFVIALCDWAATPTRRPRRMSSTIIRAPVYVLPVPGGPWIGSTVSSSPAAIRRAPSMMSSSLPTNGVPASTPPIRGGRRVSRSRAARNGPSPSMPLAMT